MSAMTRRAGLAAFGVATIAAGVAAWTRKTSSHSNGVDAPRSRMDPRERLQRYHLPNVELVTHEGKKVRFYDDLVKDRKVVINFMYTNCADDTCPITTANLVQVQKLLGNRVGRDIFFYSITLSPDQDTPAVLARHARPDRRPGPHRALAQGARLRVRRSRGRRQQDQPRGDGALRHRAADDLGSRAGHGESQASPDDLLVGVRPAAAGQGSSRSSRIGDHAKARRPACDGHALRRGLAVVLEAAPAPCRRRRGRCHSRTSPPLILVAPQVVPRADGTAGRCTGIQRNAHPA